MKQLLWSAALVVGVAGCGQRSDRVAVVVARGQATLDGKPMAGALLIFHPVVANESAPKPRARVGEDGAFVVETFDTGDGMPPGAYVVTIDWRKQTTEDGNEPPNLAPARFTRVEASPLKVQVAPGPDGACELPPFQITR